MCFPKAPKAPAPIPIAPPPPGAPVIDQQIIDARDRARKQAAARSGGQANILAGNAAPTAPTLQNKTLTGA